MPPAHPTFSDAVSRQCTQVLYRCLEEVGSTKGALYLRNPKGMEPEGGFRLVSEFGWPRGARPPEHLQAQDPVLVWANREKRPFAVNNPADYSELDPFRMGAEASRFLLAAIYLKGDWVGLLVQRDRTKGAAYDPERDEKPTLQICNDILEILSELRVYSDTPKAAQDAPKKRGPGSTAPMEVAIGYLPAASAIREESLHGEHLGGFHKQTSEFSQLPWEHEALSGAVSKPLIGRVDEVAERPLPDRITTPTTHLTRLEEISAGDSAFSGKRPGMALPEQRAFFWETARMLSALMALDAVALWMEEPEENRPILAFSDRPLSVDLQQQILAHATFHLPSMKEEDLRILTRPEKREVLPLSGVFTTYFPLMLGDEDQANEVGRDMLLLFRLEDTPFTFEEQAQVNLVGRMLSLHLDEGRLHERYHRAFLSVSHRILKSGESRAPKMREHSLTCAKLSRNIALKLELPTADVEAISIAAILHDVGSLLLDPAMMKKPELSAEELAKVRTHPVLAATFLKDLRFPFDVLKIIRHHHERWDGRGYPDGLAGDAIPMGSRIIGLVEAFDVMTTGKGYKQPKLLAATLDEIRAEAGAQFDPKAVEALVSLVGKGKGLSVN